MDGKFTIKTITATPNPQQTCWIAMHQDHSDNFAGNFKLPSEEKAGELVIKHCLAGDRGHFGVLEHPQITLACGYFPHSVMQQLRTHRIGITFDVQSFRYTGNQIIEVAENKRDIEEVFYLRPLGKYSDYRHNNHYEYSLSLRDDDKGDCRKQAQNYALRIRRGQSFEHARGLLCFDYRQHFVMSCNARSLMHLLDLRWKKDCQIEMQWFAQILFQRFAEWMPQISHWYFNHRANKARLSP